MTANDHAPDEMPELGETWRDRAVAVVKGGVGTIPFAGSILAEVVGQVIPQQRLDRLESYVRKLDERLDLLDQERLQEAMQDPERVDIFEEGAFQSARALSEERRDYIASIVASGLSGDDQARIEAKRLLGLLAEIDDDQIIYLAGQLSRHRRDPSYFEKHSSIFHPPLATLAADQDTLDAATLHELARAELVRLGLMRTTFASFKKGEMPEFDPKTGAVKARSREITPLGRLLLRNIGLAQAGEF